jgi:hypothetical protein
MSVRHRLVAAAAVSVAVPAWAQVTYQLDSWPPPGTDSWEIFNNSQGTETEDCWVANAFTVVSGGTHLTAINFRTGSALTNQSCTAVIYAGTSMTSPAGLVRIVGSTTTMSVTAAANVVQTITLTNPVDLSVGQVFYAAILLPQVPGTLFPFTSDHDYTTAANSPPVLNRSFFDVGPTQGAAYNLDNTANATVLGGSHPVVSFAQDAANLVLTVTASGSTCYPNCDASTSPPILNANDFQCFLNKYAANDPYANCDGSTNPPILNANDFQCFLNAYAAGCS